jgi:colicin import membrane protein
MIKQLKAWFEALLKVGSRNSDTSNSDTSNSDDLRGPIIFSIAVHLLLVIIFSISDFVSDTKVLVKPKELKYIKTVVIQKQGKVAEKEQQATKKIEDDRIKEVRRKEQQQRQVEEQKRIAAVKAKKDEALKEKTEQEKKKLEEQEKKALLDKKKAEQEAKEKAEKEKALKEQQRKRQEALLKQRQEREAQLQKMREAREQQEALVKKREALEKQRQEALVQQDAPVLSEYEGHIQNKISQSWQRPLSARNGMQATLQINLLPGGDVDNVKVIQSSGDASFDLSATQAVWKASPLPVPSDAGVFTRNYRVFNLLFAPEDLWQ